VAVTVVSALLAVATGRDGVGVLAVAAAVLASQLAVGWSNDAIDAGRDAVVGRADKPIVAGTVSRRTVATAAVVATVATPPLALLSGPAAGVLLTVGLISALLYNWPLKFTAASVAPYLVSFAALPAFVLAGVGRSTWWLIAAGSLLGAGAHFANALPDLADDTRTGVRGLPHRIGARPSAVAAAVLLFAATALLTLGPPGPPSWIGVVAAAAAAVVLAVGGYAASRHTGSRAVFRSVLVVAVLDVVLLLSSGLRA
jgi:4-hydroxybenzoate polyprenyltransferase